MFKRFLWVSINKLENNNEQTISYSMNFKGNLQMHFPIFIILQYLFCYLNTFIVILIYLLYWCKDIFTAHCKSFDLFIIFHNHNIYCYQVVASSTF